jgi:Tol biopolymer transport system component
MMRSTQARAAAAVVGATILFLSLVGIASAMHFTPWGTPVNAESVPGTSSDLNTPFNDGCPIQSPDGLSLYMATNRPGGLGGQDIWVARRSSRDARWGAPVNLGEPVNSGANDFCPTPLRGKRLLFVSERGGPGTCGGADIYITRLSPAHGWADPQDLGCEVNSPAGEAGPSYFESPAGAQLYFSSTRAGGSDIYASPQLADGSFGPAVPITSLNTASDDFRPNVRKDGLEVVFDSNRDGGLGGQDIWSSTRESVDDEWSPPVNLTTVNSPFGETRASLSWDGLTLTFGSNRPGGEGMADVYESTREKLVESAR